MLDFYLLFRGDIVFVSLLTIIYFIYSFVKKERADKSIKYVLLFIFSFYWLFFVLHIWFRLAVVRSMAGMGIVPISIISYLLTPIHKNLKTRDLLLVVLLAYILFFVALWILHFFSNM